MDIFILFVRIIFSKSLSNSVLTLVLNDLTTVIVLSRLPTFLLSPG